MTSIPVTPSCRAVLMAALASAVVGACTSLPPAPAVPAAAPALSTLSRYRCDHGVAFTVQYGADSVTIDAGARGRELLLRDAGGLTPQHTIYGNERLKAEFGVGPDGREAILRFAEPPLLARCMRD